MRTLSTCLALSLSAPRLFSQSTPADSLAKFHLAADLSAQLLLSEPQLQQPVFLNFDERGRMWVVEYRQYPNPAGITALSHDTFWRAVYDKVPPAPPHQFPGADRISIYEDTHGNGVFDRHKVFLDGLSIVTAVERGRGGVWVLNPPYLLFYPDANNDDIPDGDPVVHLAGFGLEDTHSVANSLRWGPDGWLYGAQGSTVTGHMIRPGLDKEPFLHTMGQGIWRYHPATRRFEFFAEGGGNTFGVELDSQARLFSGHNGGDTRGFHYVQGGYLRKGFEKHGALSNPFAFGFYEPMAHHAAERFTHNFVIYEGGALPAHYWGRLLGIEPLQGRVVESEILPEGSTFRTRDLSRPLTSDDSWFHPVDIKNGPDGALYLADWYNAQITHSRSADGAIAPGYGRIYRLTARDAKPALPFDLGKLSGPELANVLWHPNKWFRQSAQRLLADRRDASLIPLVSDWLDNQTGQIALESLWALNACGGFQNEPAQLRALSHPDAPVREWAVRLLCDESRVSPAISSRLIALARSEPDLEVRLQWAASARRLPTADCLAIARGLCSHDSDASDARVPLMIWWALESRAASDRDALVALFADSALWERPLVRDQLLSRLMRRFAQSGTRPELLACARLLEIAPTVAHSRRLMEGFEAAFKGRSLAGLPDELIAAMSRHHVGSPALSLRMGEPGALENALKSIGDEHAKAADRLAYIQVLGEIDAPSSIPVLLDLAEHSGKPADATLRAAALVALQRYDREEIGARVTALYAKLDDAPLAVAQTLLASRAAWALQLAKAVDAKAIDAGAVPAATVRQMRNHRELPELSALLARHWPEKGRATTEAMSQTIVRLTALLRDQPGGNPYRGREVFQATCAACHALFGDGGQIGPDLTSFRRDETLLPHIVNPSLEIREGYENVTVQTRDGRALGGFLAEQDNSVMVLRGLDGQLTTLPRKDVARLDPAGISLMPEGLLEALGDSKVLDLFAYLRMTQPLVLPKAPKK